MKTQHFNGLHFTRDDRTGYYLNSTIKKRMHRYVWEFYNGEIQAGCEIHHKDHNPANNDIDNLELMTAQNHRKYHAKIRGIKNVESGHLENIRGMAKEWHASAKGLEWHRKHYERTKDKLHAKRKFICEFCRKEFEAEYTGSNRFCSNKCKSAWRRNSGIDDETRECRVCGRHFTINKYSRTRTCSRVCGAKLRKG